MAIGSKFQIFLIAVCAFNLSTHAEDAASSSCDEALLLSGSASVLASNLTLSFGQASSPLREGEQAAFATYVKNEKIFNSPLLATAIAWELKGGVYSVGKTEVLRRLRILPVLNDKEQIRSLAQGAAVKLLMLFQDEFDFRETQAVDKMAQTLGVRIDELSEILKNWKSEAELVESFEKLISMVEFLLVHENLRLEVRIKKLSNMSFYSFKTRALLKGSNHWEIFLGYRNEGPKLKDKALFFVSRYLELNNSIWLRSHASRIEGASESESLALGAGEASVSSSHPNAKVDFLFVDDGENLRDEYRIPRITQGLREKYKSINYEELQRFLYNIRANFLNYSRGYALSYKSSLDRAGKNLSNLDIWKIPTQMELIHELILKLDLKSGISHLQLCYVKRNILDLTKDILQKWIHWYGDENTAEHRADILNFTKHLMDEKIKEYRRLNPNDKSPGDSLNMVAVDSSVVVADGAAQLLSVSKEAKRWDAFFSDGLKSGLILKSEGSGVIGKHKIENGKYVSSGKEFIEGKSYEFEELPFDLQELIQGNITQGSLESGLWSFWAFSNIKDNEFTIFNSQEELLVRIVAP
ncbi:MAG: hypothetical protein KA116_05100 [Proteobacteria bacterium]|nr:hypothetical protein [Pseudomonadota bacterium]